MFVPPVYCHSPCRRVETEPITSPRSLLSCHTRKLVRQDFLIHRFSSTLQNSFSRRSWPAAAAGAATLIGDYRGVWGYRPNTEDRNRRRPAGHNRHQATEGLKKMWVCVCVSEGAKAMRRFFWEKDRGRRLVTLRTSGVLLQKWTADNRTGWTGPGMEADTNLSFTWKLRAWRTDYLVGGPLPFRVSLFQGKDLGSRMFVPEIRSFLVVFRCRFSYYAGKIKENRENTFIEKNQETERGKRGRKKKAKEVTTTFLMKSKLSIIRPCNKGSSKIFSLN